MRRNTMMAVGIMLLFLVVGAIVGSSITFSSTQTLAQPPDPSLQERLQKFSERGLDFAPADEASVVKNQAIISRQQAINAALRLVALKESPKILSVAVGNLSDASLKNAQASGIKVDPRRVDMGLVWIVTLDGIESVSMGPPDAPHNVAHEYNIVLDARTGAYIMAFPT